MSQPLDYETPRSDDALPGGRPSYLRPPGCFLFALLIATGFVLLLVLSWLYDMHWRH